MKNLYLIRHGKTAANYARLYCGSTDLPLDENGALELRQLSVGAGYPDISACRVLTSTLVRTEQTLLELYGDMPHETVPEFNEMDFGSFEMYSYEQLRDDPEYQRWITGDNEKNICPGGESAEQMRERALGKLIPLIREERRDVCIFTHGGVIACFMQELFPGAGKNRYQWQPENGKGYVVSFEDGEPLGFAEIPPERPERQ